jgi:hypothetical protein
MILKGAIALLVAGIICFAVYSFTSKPDYDLVYDMGQSSLHAKVMSSEIFPKSAYTNNALKIRMHNANKDEYLYIAVKWFRNGQEIYDYNDPSLVPEKFKKGDQIHAEVNILGPDALEEPVVTLPVTILNTPPQIIEASTILDEAAGDVIKIRVNAMDADHDNIRYRYRWFVNDSEVGGHTKATFDLARCKNGDKVHAIVVANDTEDDSYPYEAEPLTLGSNAPEITSNPPTGVGEDRRYKYQLVANTPDPKGLIYSLLVKPEGMTISDKGLIEWDLPAPKLGSQAYEVVVKVADSTGGEAFQEFEINVTGTRR